MEQQNKVRVCLEVIKDAVKQSSMGYQELADRLGVSLLTIKRQLNGDEISMSKLLALCDAAQLNFADIWKQVELRKAEHFEFSTEQDRAFYHFPHLFHYFLSLHIEKLTPKEIQDRWKLLPASTHLYLRKLEKLGLLTLSEKGNATMLVSEPIGFAGDSLNFRKSAQGVLQHICDNILAKEEVEEAFAIIKPMILSKVLREKMYDDLKEVVSRYAELSERYFLDSGEAAKLLVICDPAMPTKEEPLADIVDVAGF